MALVPCTGDGFDRFDRLGVPELTIRARRREESRTGARQLRREARRQPRCRLTQPLPCAWTEDAIGLEPVRLLPASHRVGEGRLVTREIGAHAQSALECRVVGAPSHVRALRAVLADGASLVVCLAQSERVPDAEQHAIRQNATEGISDRAQARAT